MKKWNKQQMKDIVQKYSEEKQLRRKYFNMIQEMHGNIRVFCRVRPLLSNEIKDKNIITIGKANSSLSHDDDYYEDINIYDLERFISLSFKFHRIFGPKSTQSQIFSEISPLIQSVLSGYNVCIFAFGQTGSGKTYTMSGTKLQPGVNFRALSMLFDTISNQTNIEYSLSISLMEIYKESIIDLLQIQKKRHMSKSANINRLQSNLRPSLQADGSILVANLVKKSVQSKEEVISALIRGIENRKTGITNLNQHSSRSHLILSVYIHGCDKINREVIDSKLHLIDLAGSERTKKSQAKGERFKEAVAINSSLSALADVISARSQKNRKHIPYRRSILTFLLKDSLDKHCKTAMIVQISPSHRQVSESSCSLKFAARVKEVQLGKAKKNIRKESDHHGRKKSTN